MRDRRRGTAAVVAVAAVLALVAAAVVAERSGGDHSSSSESPTGRDDTTPAERGDPRLRLTRRSGPFVLTLVDARADDDGGLVSLRARNRGDAPLSVSNRAVSVRQGGAELRAAPFPATRLPRFPASIGPGSAGRAVLWFPRLRAEGALVTVPWFTTDPDVDPEPVRFRVAVRDVATVSALR